MGVLLFVIFDKAERTSAAKLAPSPAAQLSDAEQVHGSTQSIGQYLFQNQMVNLELAGLILTVSMVGAIVIARRRVVGHRRDGSSRASRPSPPPPRPSDDDPHSIPVYGTTNPRQKAFPEH